MESAIVVAGNDATAAQYNNLRKDIVRAGGDYAVSGGAANVQTLSIDAQYDAYVAGDVLVFKAGFTNTGAITLNVNSKGAKSIKKQAGAALEAGDITANQIVVATYNGTDFLMSSILGSQMTTAQKAILVGGVASDADALHTHDDLKPISYGDDGGRAAAAASGTEVIAHNLGRIPRKLEIFAVESGGTHFSNGVAGSSRAENCVTMETGGGGVRLGEIIHIETSANGHKATVSAWDATDFTLTWTKIGVGEIVLFVWIASA